MTARVEVGAGRKSPDREAGHALLSGLIFQLDFSTGC